MRQFGGAWTANADKNEKGEDTDISENQATDDVVGPQRSAENSQAVFVKLCERMAVSTCPYVSAMDRTVRALGAAYTLRLAFCPHLPCGFDCFTSVVPRSWATRTISPIASPSPQSSASGSARV